MEVSYNLDGYLDVRLWKRTFELDFYAMRSNKYGDIHLFSPNQKLQIIAKTEKLINTYDVDDCPVRLRHLLSMLKEGC